MLIYCLIIISYCWFSIIINDSCYYHQCGKGLSGFFDKFKQHLFEIEIFCNIINVFTSTFYNSNVYLLNKMINLAIFLKIHPKTICIFKKFNQDVISTSSDFS